MVKILSNNLYVDNLNAGAETVEETFELATTAQSILADAGFPLRKFASSSTQLRELLPKPSSPTTVSLYVDNPTKMLGLVWDR